MRSLDSVLAILGVLLILPVCAAAQSGADADWPVYGHSAAGDRYSTLTQITPANVGGLREAWAVHDG